MYVVKMNFVGGLEFGKQTNLLNQWLFNVRIEIDKYRIHWKEIATNLIIHSFNDLAKVKLKSGWDRCLN